MPFTVKPQPNGYYQYFISLKERRQAKKAIARVSYEVVEIRSSDQSVEERTERAARLMKRLHDTIEENGWVIEGCLGVWSNAALFARSIDKPLEPYSRHAWAAYDSLSDP